jgi:hypothetical protein
MVTKATQRGQNVLLQVNYSAYCNTAHFPLPSQLNQWADFVEWAAFRARYISNRPVHVEVWNEPNVNLYWSDHRGLVDPSWYANIYYYAWQGVQDAEALFGTDMPVMTAGAGNPQKGCGANDANFMCVTQFLTGVKNWLITNNALGRVAYAGAHIYPKTNTQPGATVPPQSRSDSTTEALAQVADVRSVFGSKDTFITESGVRSSYPFSEAMQCQRLLDIYDYVLSEPHVKALMVFSVVDLDNWLGASNDYGYMGVFNRVTGQYKPAATWLWVRQVMASSATVTC